MNSLVHVSTKLAPDLASELRRRAEAGDRTVSHEIRRALRAYLAPVDEPSTEGFTDLMPQERAA